jgi:hypothetical protein
MRLRRFGRRASSSERSTAARPQSEPLPSFVFVVTYGRSGSTLVQGILNTLPATTVRGENGFYVWELFQAHRRAASFAEAHAQHRPRKVESAFYGAHRVTDGRLARLERSLVLGLLLDGGKRPEHVGFKEVLWHRIPREDTEDFFQWFERLFPEARYVLNTRAMEDASTSGFWRSYDKDEALAAMRRVVEIQDHLRRTRPDRVLDTRYEVITGEDREASDAALLSLAEFVTGRADATMLGRMRAVLEVGHGPHPFKAVRGASRQQDDRG